MHEATMTYSPPCRLASTIWLPPAMEIGTSPLSSAPSIAWPEPMRLRSASSPSSARMPASLATQSGAMVAAVVV
jgi:hypothetical protein